MTRVLVVDDEPSIRTVLRGYLEREGFEVTEAADASAALKAFDTRPAEVVLLDIMLPGEDGLAVLRTIRQRSDAFVLLVSARTEELDRLVGLTMGADDYIAKPFSPREVVARVKAMLRRGRNTTDEEKTLRFDGLVIDVPGRAALRENVDVGLSSLEFDLLVALAGSPGRVFSRGQLLHHVWGYDFFGDERVVDVHIRNLRAKLGDPAVAPVYIATVRGAGYKFIGSPA